MMTEIDGTIDEMTGTDGMVDERIGAGTGREMDGGKIEAGIEARGEMTDMMDGDIGNAWPLLLVQLPTIAIQIKLAVLRTRVLEMATGIQGMILVISGLFRFASREGNGPKIVNQEYYITPIVAI